MTIFTFANNVDTMLAGAFSSTATSFTLASTAHLPTSIPSGEYLVITLNDAATRGNFEVIYVGTISGATCSNLLRAQEGTVALSWLTGDYAYCGPTDGQMAQLTQIGQFPSSFGYNGYKKIPDPNASSGFFIQQWGVVDSIPGNSGSTVTYPIAFPNVCYGMTVTPVNNGTVSTGAPGYVIGSSTTATIYNTTSLVLTLSWTAWGD